MQDARPWDGLLSAAVRHGLTSPSSASPDVAALSPFPADTPETGVVEPLGEDELRAREATDLVEEEDAAAQLSEMAASLAAETRRRLQGALARSVELLRSTPSAAELQAELEAWLLEAGRLEATLEDALEASTGALAASAERLARAHEETSACRRALEVQVAQATEERRRGAAQQLQLAAEYDEERKAAQHAADMAAAELAQARAELDQAGGLHERRLRQEQLVAAEEAGRAAEAARAECRAVEAAHAQRAESLKSMAEGAASELRARQVAQLEAEGRADAARDELLAERQAARARGGGGGGFAPRDGAGGAPARGDA